MAGASAISRVLIETTQTTLSKSLLPVTLLLLLCLETILLYCLLFYSVLLCPIRFPLFFVTLSVPGNCSFLFYYIKQEYFQDMYSYALELMTFKGQ